MTQPGAADWFSEVQAPLDLPDPDDLPWHDQTDVLVVGYGGAGVVAALEAREQGAKVLALDRFGGGGATAISGGVYYGGATPYQRQAGYDDTAEQMLRYLRLEVEDAVSDATLRAFCEQSAPNLAWLEQHGVPFEASLCPEKTSYPTDKHYLYFSGNEAIDRYAAAATPAPRGHRAKGRGLPGMALYGPLRASADRLGVQVRAQTQVVRLITHAGRVIGVEARAVRAGWAAWQHHLAWRAGQAVRNYAPGLARSLAQRCARLERDASETLFLRAHRGVVLCTGGFIHNRAMLHHYAPAYRPGMPLGTPGCDGSGIRLGQSVGAATDRLDRVSAWRFINPPLAWAQGIFVNRQGERYCNEAVYGAKLGYHMVEEQGGVGLLVLDDALRREAFRQLAPGRAQWFQQAPGVLNMLANCRSAATIEQLAALARVPPEALRSTIDAYNHAIATSAPDPLGKPDSFRRPLLRAPFHVMDCGVASKRFPCPTLTLGGLRVDERTGAVLSEAGAVIPGLFAAGRAAVGVSSNQYVSGLSIADCVFSGRRAARAASAPPNADPHPEQPRE